MQRVNSWHIDENFSMPLTVALFIRDALGLPATRPFFVPPLVPPASERIPVIGPLTDGALADDWAQWFTRLLTSSAHALFRGELPLEGCPPALLKEVERHLPAAGAAAQWAKAADSALLRSHWKVTAPMLSKLVHSIERQEGRKAVPFELHIHTVPVAGFWVHSVDAQRVLTNRTTLSNSGAMTRQLGPLLRQVAR